MPCLSTVLQYAALLGGCESEWGGRCPGRPSFLSLTFFSRHPCNARSPHARFNPRQNKTKHRTAGPEHAERLIRWLGEAGLWGEALRLVNEYEEDAKEKEKEKEMKEEEKQTQTAAGTEGAAALLAPAPSHGGGGHSSGATAGMYRGALRACALAGRGEEARAVVSQMAAGGHAITEAEPAAAMDALANGGRPLEAVELLAQLQRGEWAAWGVAGPGLACYNAALKAWAAAGRAGEAVALLGHMYASPQAPAPDAASFNTALLACARKGDWRLALDLVRLMERLNNPNNHPLPSSPRLLNTTAAAASTSTCTSTSTSTTTTTTTTTTTSNAEASASISPPPPSSACSAAIAVGILGPQHQHQQAAGTPAAPQPLFAPSSPLSAPLLLSSASSSSGSHPPNGGGAAGRVPPSLVTYNTLLQSFVKAQPPQPLLALSLFESLCTSACPYLAPDAISFNLAIIAAGQGAWCGGPALGLTGCGDACRIDCMHGSFFA
jgi:pentatricopeptide repeat protein